MIDLLYLSRTVVPAHLGELEQLDLLYRDEQVLVALDGVLLDDKGKRLSGPTLHDYCLITGQRMLLWARDYGEHLCYAFPLAELCTVTGQGMDPLHAMLQLRFEAEEEGQEPQQFSLSLLPLADLPMALVLLNSAADAARSMADTGATLADTGAEVMAVLSARIFGDETAEVQQPMHLRQLGPQPYRWQPSAAASPGPATSSIESAPEMLYTLGRVGRSAWDTIVRSLRENDLPFEIGGEVRDITDMMRAANDLLSTIANSPEARETVMDMIGAVSPGAHTRYPSETDDAAEPDVEAPSSGYHEIPLRRHTVAPPERPTRTELRPLSAHRIDEPTIPLRRRRREA